MREWAVILGSSSGTGAAIAAAVARSPGLNVFGMHRGRYRADRVIEQVRAAGAEVIMHQGDAASPEGTELGADALLAAAGPRSVKLFVHSIASASVGLLASAAADQLHPRQIVKSFDAMAHSFVYWAQALRRRDLLADNARLLGLTNPLSETLLHNTGVISAAKAALEMYVRHLAVELGPLGHRVNLLKFGTVATPAIQHVYDEAALARLEAQHRRMNPCGRMCTVEEVGRFVSILAGQDVDWFNGATIDFTGGMVLRLIDLVLNEQPKRTG